METETCDRDPSHRSTKTYLCPNIIAPVVSTGMVKREGSC